MDRFSKLHPIFHFLYFIGMFALVVSVYNPFFVAVSFLGVIAYEINCRGRQALSSLKLTIAVVLVVSMFNMLFAHYGEDVLFVIGNTEFTLEALFYGVNQGFTLATMILWFGAFSRTTDSEKVIYVFRFAPKTALLFSMVLGFIPRFSRKLKEIEDAQLGLNGGQRRYSRIKTAINNPLTENKIDNAKGVIFNVRGGENLSLTEINTAVQAINDKVSEDANIIFGTVIDESLQDEMEVTVVATGVEE